MQYLVYFTVSPDTPISPPTPEGMAAMGAFMAESMEKGLVVSTGQLQSTVTHVTLEDDEISVTDGPFMEGKELVPGFTIIETETKQQAIEWTTELRRCMGEGTLRMASIFIPDPSGA